MRQRSNGRFVAKYLCFMRLALYVHVKYVLNNVYNAVAFCIFYRFIVKIACNKVSNQKNV